MIGHTGMTSWYKSGLANQTRRLRGRAEIATFYWCSPDDFSNLLFPVPFELVFKDKSHSCDAPPLPNKGILY